jgi:peptidoglycan/xylan/chitin deacetylase (PgdA/CDA1 family)
MQMRLDRLLTLYCVSPWLRLQSRKDRSIPILMYHSITDQQEAGVHPYYRTSTTPAALAAQLKHLRNEGYASCNLAQALHQLQAEASDHTKLVVITFDDGYRDFYDQAFSILNQYGFSATIFLPTAYIGASPISFKGKDCLSWGEVRELSRHGILFGSHTETHPQLRELSRAAVNQELANSKKTIEEKLGCAVESFAYPYAFPQADTDFTRVLRDSLRQAGYENGVCTIVGRANRKSEPFFLERLPVNSCDDAALFAAKLTGAYDWISGFQYVSKMVKARLRSSASANRNAFKDFPLVQ